MYRSLLRDARFSELLMKMDRDRLEEVRCRGCSKCGGPLHAGHFKRKPAGILVAPEQLPEGYATRFDLCCGWCRSRTLPSSVRFLGRKVFVTVAIVVATVLVRGSDLNAIELLRRQLGASRSTLARWCRWWRALTGTALWTGSRGTLPMDLDEQTLPASLLARFCGSAADRMLHLLRFLRPLSGRVPEQAGCVLTSSGPTLGTVTGCLYTSRGSSRWPAPCLPRDGSAIGQRLCASGPRSPTESRKEADIRIRVTDAQKRTLVDAATKAGLGVSSWLLTLGLREASKADGGGKG